MTKKKSPKTSFWGWLSGLAGFAQVILPFTPAAPFTPLAKAAEAFATAQIGRRARDHDISDEEAGATEFFRKAAESGIATENIKAALLRDKAAERK